MHLTSAQDFQKHLFQTHPDALCSGSATGNLCVCSEAGASPAWGTPWCGPSAPWSFSNAVEIFSYFSPAKGEKKAQRQLLLQGMLAAGATLAPWGLESGREGDTVCPPCSCTSSWNPLAPQKTHQVGLPPKPALGGREGEARLCPVGTRRQIPIQGNEVANPPLPTPSLQRLLLALCNLLVWGIKFQH